MFLLFSGTLGNLPLRRSLGHHLRLDHRVREGGTCQALATPSIHDDVSRACRCIQATGHRSSDHNPGRDRSGAPASEFGSVATDIERTEWGGGTNILGMVRRTNSADGDAMGHLFCSRRCIR